MRSSGWGFEQKANGQTICAPVPSVARPSGEQLSSSSPSSSSCSCSPAAHKTGTREKLRKAFGCCVYEYEWCRRKDLGVESRRK